MVLMEEVMMIVCDECRSSVCCVVLFLGLCILVEASVYVCRPSCIVLMYVFCLFLFCRLHSCIWEGTFWVLGMIFCISLVCSLVFCWEEWGVLSRSGGFGGELLVWGEGLVVVGMGFVKWLGLVFYYVGDICTVCCMLLM